MTAGGRVLRCEVGKERAGRTLAGFLSARFPYHAPEKWARLVSEGAVSVNEVAAAPDRVLAPGDVVRYCPPESPEPAVDTAVAVLHEDADIIVVNKTGNLPAHPTGRYFRNTLWSVLRDRLGVAAPGIINRLDRETSGVTLVAKNPEAAAACARQFTERRVTKRYTVFVEGVLAGPIRARGYIGPCSGSAVRIKRRFAPAKTAEPETGREAEWADTEFKLLESRGGISVVEVIPHTGRMHQIRATLFSLGYPVVGDKIYGPDEGIFLRFINGSPEAGDAVKLRVRRHALHAAELSFSHPSCGRRMAVSAPLPADMAELLAGR